MSTLATLRFDNAFARLHPSLFEVVDPTPLSNPYLVAFNPDAAALIDLDASAASDPMAPAYLSGAVRLPGAEPVAMLYAGHQFGVWVPQLGDGRAILLGQVQNGRGQRWDLHLKGGGPTRFSRAGDGRAVLRSTIREYLASEAMHALGIPTTRALSIVGSDDPVYRETAETAATLIRMAPSHIRFGSFQILASRRLTDRVRELADHVIEHHEPDLRGLENRYRLWLVRTVERTATTIAQWMAVGFAHGVMNTDNMSILGLTLDYGPYGFVEEYDPGFICNHSDHDGRYAFDRQPAIGLWNLARFAESLIPIISLEDANLALEQYPARFEAAYGALMRAKLGLRIDEPEDVSLVGEMLSMLAANRVDFTHWFRALSHWPDEAHGGRLPLGEVMHDLERLEAWTVRYRARLAREGSDQVQRHLAMRQVNPKYVLRNYLAQQAIEKAQAREYSEIASLMTVLRRPFDEHPDLERYAQPAPPWARDLMVSCSS